MVDTKKLPDAAQNRKTMPDEAQQQRDLPLPGNPENMVTLGGETIEIKPTKLKYMRNHTAAFYKVLELYPLPDVLAMEAGAFEDSFKMLTRNAEKLLYILNFVLANDGIFFTSNYYITNGYIEQRPVCLPPTHSSDDCEVRRTQL